MRLLKVNYGLFLMLSVMTQISEALPSDKAEVIHVVADSADLNQSKHRGTYTGHVAFVQGTTNLHADHATTLANIKNQLTVAIAYGAKGEQAHFWSQTEPNKPPFHAYADTIRYFPLRHLIELIGNAHVEQGKNSLSAAKISYDTEKQHVLTQRDKHMRTTIILYPNKKS